MSTVDLCVHSEIRTVPGYWERVRTIRTFVTHTCRHGAGSVRAWAERRRQRSELLAYLASDHRAAADMGLKSIDFDWSTGSFGTNKSRTLEIASLGPFAKLR
jgi:hypothetical protein